jgi:hypothetical protein
MPMLGAGPGDTRSQSRESTCQNTCIDPGPLAGVVAVGNALVSFQI